MIFNSYRTCNVHCVNVEQSSQLPRDSPFPLPFAHFFESGPNPVSRKFGFVGYKTPEEARAAQKYFNGSFLDTAKLMVDFAIPVRPAIKLRFGSEFCWNLLFVFDFISCILGWMGLRHLGACPRSTQLPHISQYGDETLPRAWSKYSAGSSAHNRKEEQAKALAEQQAKKVGRLKLDLA